MGHEDPWGLHEETSQDAFHLGHVALQNLGVQVGLKIDVAVHTEVHQDLVPLVHLGPSHSLDPSYYLGDRWDQKVGKVSQLRIQMILGVLTNQVD